MLLFRTIGMTLQLPSSSGRIFPKLNQLVRHLDTQRNLVAERHSWAIGLASRGILLLQQIISSADPASLMSLDGDFQRCVELINLERILTGLFDVVDTGTRYKNTFVAGQDCEEFLIPVRMDDYFRMLPFDQGWDAWDKIRPFRVLDHNSRELTFRTLNNQIVFKNRTPDYCIMGLDVITLVLQWLHYTQEYPQNDMSMYLHEYVIGPILEDLQTIWLRHLYYDTITGSEFRRTGNAGDIYYGIPSDALQAMDSLTVQLPSVVAGSITPEAMLTSLPVYNEQSITSHILSLMDYCTIPERRQYWVYHYLTQMPWLKFVVAIFRMNRDYIRTRNLQTYLTRDIEIFKGYNFTSGLHSSTLRQMIDRDSEQTFNWLLKG